jgi:transcriptional regulator with PAS, ATPase and Fis domain
VKNSETHTARELFQQKHGIVGTSIEIEEIVNVVQQVAPTDITVLISGESGVGKEVVAQAIHAASKRSKKPMVTVNCGAIPEGIIESELFGHEKGSFTGASDTRKGYFELADGGTIFLDEIGELPPGTQVKFLRILENGEFMRVGSPVARKVDVRVIAATNKDLEGEVRTKRFRADLFYRLRSVNMRIPPLRERRGDIPVLFDKFAKDYAAANAIVFGGITEEAMDVLLKYYWPGNVRELRNVVESMMVIENGRKLTADDVRKYLKGFQSSSEERNLPVLFTKTPDIPERELIYRALVDMKNEILELRSLLLDSINGERRGTPIMHHAGSHGALSLEDMERNMIIESLEKYAGNRRSAAQALKISERTLYRKIKEYGLQ